MKDIRIASNMVVILAVLLLLSEIIARIHGAPVSTNSATSVTCPPRSGTCWWEPEDTCNDNADCPTFSNRRISLCCPHACIGKKICMDFALPAPPTTAISTVEGTTTTEYTTRQSTESLTTAKMTPVHTTSVTTAASSEAPTSDFESTTELSTRNPSTVEPSTTQRVTTEEERSTTVLPTTTELPTTTLTPSKTLAPTISTTDLPTTVLETTKTEPITTATETPTTTKLSTTTSPLSTTLQSTKSTSSPTTSKSTPDPSVCGRSATKDILFVIDSTVNPRQYWPTSARQFKQIKQLLKDVISELKGDKFRIGVLQYGQLKEPKMEIDFPEGMPTSELNYQIDDIVQMGGSKRLTGSALATASNKLYELNSLYERASAQDIVVLITRGRPSDKKQTSAEVEMLKRRKVRVITIGLTSYPRYLKRYLEYIPSSEQDLLFSTYSELTNQKTKVLKKLCLPAELPGTRSLCYNKQYDIHFVLDGSRSIKHFEFDRKRKFLRDVFFLLESESDLNIGMMQFSTVDKTEEVLELQKHSLDEELYVIENMDYHSGRRTMLGNALSQVNNKVFTGRDGDRSGVENVLVIFSDGEAHDIEAAYREADDMKGRYVRVIAISVSERGYIGKELKKLATDLKHTLSIELSNTAYFAKKAVSMICETEE